MGLVASVATLLDRRIGWQRLPRPLGILTLAGLRTRLRERNLYDTGLLPGEPAGGNRERALSARTIDGTYNDLDRPLMGSVGARFGRNVPLAETFPEPDDALLEPSPRVVSRELLTRETFRPAATVNVLAAAWLQFEVHDWFSHGKNESERPWEVALADDDPWYERPMRIPRTRRDPTSDTDPATPPTYTTGDSHWWDASQIYGSDPAFATAIRANEDGKLRLDDEGLLPADLDQHVDLTGVAGNFWIGLGVLHTLFTHEHNAICDRLRAAYPTWPDDRLYDTARLVNAALMAKIHTVEWTPAIIAHPTTKLAIYNEFRRLFQKEPVRSFLELSGDPAVAAELERVYGPVERLDVMPGLYAERLPAGFGFSDTAFRVFVLMASRRLKSDRFFTRDYRPEVYTREGLDWINESSMKAVLLRHYPELAPALAGVENGFAPWTRTGTA